MTENAKMCSNTYYIAENYETNSYYLKNWPFLCKKEKLFSSVSFICNIMNYPCCLFRNSYAKWSSYAKLVNVKAWLVD